VREVVSDEENFSSPPSHLDDHRNNSLSVPITSHVQQLYGTNATCSEEAATAAPILLAKSEFGIERGYVLVKPSRKEEDEGNSKQTVFYSEVG